LDRGAAVAFAFDPAIRHGAQQNQKTATLRRPKADGAPARAS
jgi:hypothetical protein